MSENAAHALDRLEMEQATGCLTVETAGEKDPVRLYLRNGRVYHAEGPAGEGDSALNQALAWWDAHSSFDPEADLPDKETIGGFDSIELPTEWPEDEELREEDRIIGIEAELRAMRNRAILTLVGLALLAIATIYVLSLR
ncbi:MAG: DUF4388 domain-containing protein [Candidatus Dormiibacterota bacterium]